MTITAITSDFAISPQITLDDLPAIARDGYRTLLCNRPEGEDSAQPSAEATRQAAEAAGLTFLTLPVATRDIAPEDARRMASLLAAAPKPVLAYCRSGSRAEALWRAAQALTMPGSASSARTHDVLIIGGGSAGIATAASLLKRRPGLDIAIVEPSETHDYQPGWTMVGAGIFTPQSTRRPMGSVMPKGVTWIKAQAEAFLPQENRVALSNGETRSYRMLVVAVGIRLDWAAIPGLTETLGRNGVTSNYRYDLAPYTAQLAGTLTSGRAIFTQPPMPIKCAGAPQKAMYLSCDRWRRAGVLNNMTVDFNLAGAALFGVPAYVPTLMDYIKRYGINLNFSSRLIRVDGPSQTATFEQTGPEGVELIDRPFDMLHAVPPQVPHDCIRFSPLAGESGFAEVNPATLQHPAFPNVFALGDTCSTSNAKTAAAARQQAPVVAVNLLAALDGRPMQAGYTGYGSCPLTVERGKIVLAEFGYGGKLMPSFPKWLLDGTRPTRLAWILKDHLLPPIYWQGMLKGHEWLARPQPLAAPQS